MDAVVWAFSRVLCIKMRHGTPIYIKLSARPSYTEYLKTLNEDLNEIRRQSEDGFVDAELTQLMDGMARFDVKWLCSSPSHAMLLMPSPCSVPLLSRHVTGEYVHINIS